MIANVEQFREALYAALGEPSLQVGGMDCTTGNKSTFTGGLIGALGCPRSGRTMELNSVVLFALFVGNQCRPISGHTLSCTTASPRLRIQAGGEGVGGRAAVGAYNVLRRTEFIHIALGLLGRPLVKIQTKQTPHNLSFRLQKKERGAA